MKKKILELRKGKRKMGINLWESYEGMQKKLTAKQYLLFWRVDAMQCVYIDKDNILTGDMSEKVFDTIDVVNQYGTI